MNEQDKTLFDFAEQVRRKAHEIMIMGVGGSEEVMQAGAVACEILQLAAQMKTYAEMRVTLGDPARYSLQELSTSAPSGFDE